MEEKDLLHNSYGGFPYPVFCRTDLTDRADVKSAKGVELYNC